MACLIGGAALVCLTLQSFRSTNLKVYSVPICGQSQLGQGAMQGALKTKYVLFVKKSSNFNANFKQT